MKNTDKPARDNEAENRSNRLPMAWASAASFTALLATLTSLVIYGNTSMETIYWDEPSSFIIILVLSLALFGVLLSLFQAYNSSKKRDEELRIVTIERLESIEEEEKEIADKSESDEISLPKLWALNNQRINSYHTAAVDQSVKSFRSSQVATFSGLAVILLCAGIAAFSNSTIGTISAGSVGIVGGGLSAYISSTFMKSHAAATEQLRRFFYHPVELSRMLSAERLLKDVSDSDKSYLTRLIVESTLKVQLDESRHGISKN